MKLTSTIRSLAHRSKARPRPSPAWFIAKRPQRAYHSAVQRGGGELARLQELSQHVPMFCTTITETLNRLRYQGQVRARLEPASTDCVMAGVGFNTVNATIVNDNAQARALRNAVYLVQVEGQRSPSLAFFKDNGQAELMREDGKSYARIPEGDVGVKILGKIRDEIPGLCDTKETLRIQVYSDMYKASQIRAVYAEAYPV
eukprot:CAMPEP_0167787048 /NCGR_PEP_ID=MMETSP0111_2-20121227/9173_1 /TAXON_ID=91324 /ORGANISM="Lotharella globosa, Strain CCCM811" /LENGTH=200 /DNA_ID=CAMNT_0007678581 /DNA_START=160 /DNA_END=762 /DNA_ORIENTATION=+